jgi:hypothetical protein
MIFTRTKSGLNNYAKFFSVDVTVFVEGRTACDKASGRIPKIGSEIQTSDELFHHAVLTNYSANCSFKIKSLGSKSDLAGYAKKVADGHVKNCLLIYDSDYDCVISSWVAPPWSLRTNGYSWESDLWTPGMCEDVIALFSGGRAWDLGAFRSQLAGATRRIERLSRIEVFCRIYGLNLIVPNGSSVGIKLDLSCQSLIPSSEVDRVISSIKKGLRDCRDKRLDKQLYGVIKGFDYCNLVRGHLWEAICITLIVASLKRIGVQGSLSIAAIRNVALGLFKTNVAQYLLPAAQVHYMNQQVRAGI